MCIHLYTHRTVYVYVHVLVRVHKLLCTYMYMYMYMYRPSLEDLCMLENQTSKRQSLEQIPDKVETLVPDIQDPKMEGQ